MVRKIAICFVLIAANILPGHLVVFGVELDTPPQQEPQPLSDDAAAAGSTFSQHAASKQANRKLLEQKLAERDRLQREIDGLHRTAGLPQQILVKIRALEINRSKLRRLGVDWTTADGRQISVSNVGELLQPDLAKRGNTFELNIIAPGDVFHEVLRSMDTHSLGKVLAEPSVVVLSGRPASFHMGGEFPLPAGEKSNKVVEFVNFGTQIDMLASSLGDEKVRMELRVKVSEPDYSRPITIDGQCVPALNIRQLDTAVELPFGQSAIFTGFVQQREMVVIGIDGQKSRNIEEFETLFIATPEVVTTPEIAATPDVAKAHDTPASVK